MEKRTPEEKKKIVEECIRLEKTGGDVLGYLRQMDYITPAATWMNIQKRYLGRNGEGKLTDGKPTGRTRKGKTPEIRPDALESDRLEWERSRTDGETDGQQRKTAAQVTIRAEDVTAALERGAAAQEREDAIAPRRWRRHTIISLKGPVCEWALVSEDPGGEKLICKMPGKGKRPVIMPPQDFRAFAEEILAVLTELGK